MDTTHTMTIGGEPVAASSTFEVIDPATGAAFAGAPECSSEQLEGAMAVAQSAFETWRRDVEARRAALKRAVEVIEEHAQPLAEIVTREQGKPLASAAGEVKAATFWLSTYASLPLEVEVLHEEGDRRVELHRRPLGVVAAITPWNYPLAMAAFKLGPALLAGNTVVIKPSPHTPLSTLALVALLRDVFPPGVVNAISGGDALGARMTAHPAVRKISFTGSVETGKKIMAAAASDLKRVTLELGGNDPAIVLPDVDATEVAGKLYEGAFSNGGQLCVAIKRMYVHESIYGDVVASLAARASAVKVGPGMDDGVEMGPVNNRPQLERVRELVGDAERAGGAIHAGASLPEGDGYWFSPTVVSDVAEGVRLVDEEQFGPAVPVIPFSDVEEAISRANATDFGLGGSIWTSDVARGADLAGHLECGTGWVNQHPMLRPTYPFGGFKHSGIGVENGRWGLDELCQKQVINVRGG